MTTAQMQATIYLFTCIILGFLALAPLIDGIISLVHKQRKNEKQLVRADLYLKLGVWSAWIGGVLSAVPVAKAYCKKERIGIVDAAFPLVIIIPAIIFTFLFRHRNAICKRLSKKRAENFNKHTQTIHNELKVNDEQRHQNKPFH